MQKVMSLFLVVRDLNLPDAAHQGERASEYGVGLGGGAGGDYEGRWEVLDR